jgi:uncharacterized protein (TIGR02266 family)
MPSMTDRDRRTDVRIPLRLQVEYADVEDFLIDYTANVSLGGMFIVTATPFDLGTRFKLRFALPHHHAPVEALAVVTWVEDGGLGRVAGMGVRFSDIDPDHQAAIQALLERWE